MASKTLQRIGVSPELAMRLKRHGICTCKDFLSKNELELMKVTGLSRVKLRELIEDVSRAVIPQHNTVLNIYKQNTGLFSTSLPPLDSILHGGLSHGTITEIAGPPGCGKTQFCMMFSVLATLPRPLGTANGSVAYIDTESAFSAQRLVEIARSRFPDHFNQDDNLRDLCNRVHIYQESTCRELQERLDVIEEDIIRHGVKLIIIDSIASLVRKEFDSHLHGNMIARTNLLAKQAATLKYIAESFCIPVYVCDSGLHPRGRRGTGKKGDLIVVSSCYSCMIDQNKQVLSQDSCSAEWTSIRGK
ncbi:DNA repair protein RAD51 homolog 2-like isoform X2 [Apostichopus japonicus]|uniref:DNA repair protein RAD51 homolog 2-like isoform X2 n=1 Tax=Stichopus japonicus TaxID=307972 RepID=UPI003AB205BE